MRSALQSAAAYKTPHDYPKLLQLLAQRRFRPEARAALAAFGTPILDRLNGSFLDDAPQERAVRQEIPRVMGLIGGARAARLLLSGFEAIEGRPRIPLLRALDRIRQDQPALRFDRERVTTVIVNELSRYYHGAVLLGGIPASEDSSGVAFLRRALTERLEGRLEAVFRLLALIYPRNEILDAYHWVVSGRPDLRSNALEFLDTRIEPPLRQMLLAAAEHRQGAELWEDARTLFDLERLPYTATLRRLMQGRDSWLQACTCYVVAEREVTGFESVLEDLRNNRDPLVAETAHLARERLAAVAGSDGPAAAQLP